MSEKKSIRLFILLVLIVPAIAYLVINMYEKNFRKLPVLGRSEIVNGKKVAHKISEFQMTNQDGYAKTMGDWENKIVVVNFFFTHCPVICPKMTVNMKKVQEVYGKNSGVLINSFSVDPERDSTAQLKKFAERFKIDNANWDLLTGNKKEIYRLARNGFMVVATDGDGGPDDFIHSEKFVLIDRKKRIRGYYSGTIDSEVNQLIKDIKRLRNEK